MVFQVIGSLLFRVAIVDTLYQVDEVKQVAIVASTYITKVYHVLCEISPYVSPSISPLCCLSFSQLVNWLVCLLINFKINFSIEQ